jgi:hypothetical protein
VSKAKGKSLGWTEAMIEADDNLQTICAKAHKIKTMTEQGKTLRQKVQIGVDGFPIE